VSPAESRDDVQVSYLTYLPDQSAVKPDTTLNPSGYKGMERDTSSAAVADSAKANQSNSTATTAHDSSSWKSSTDTSRNSVTDTTSVTR
jgi:hypothetical protein